MCSRARSGAGRSLNVGRRMRSAPQHRSELRSLSGPWPSTSCDVSALAGFSVAGSDMEAVCSQHVCQFDGVR